MPNSMYGSAWAGCGYNHRIPESSWEPTGRLAHWIGSRYHQRQSKTRLTSQSFVHLILRQYQQTHNKMKTTKYLQNQSSIGLEWWWQQKTGFVLIISMKTMKNWNDDDKNTLSPLTCLGPMYNIVPVSESNWMWPTNQICSLWSHTRYVPIL